MGLFDDVRCEIELPGEPKPKHKRFQTHGFDDGLDLYTITADRKLTKKDHDNDEHREFEFDGSFHFYAFEHEGENEFRFGIWFEYVATFKRGELQNIELFQIFKQGIGPEREMIFKRADIGGGEA